MSSSRRGQRSAPHQSVAILLRVALLLLPLLAFAAPREARAYQWMLKHSYTSCNACHTDPSGGELLTPYGRMQSEAALSMAWGGSGSGSARSTTQRQRLLRTEI